MGNICSWVSARIPEARFYEDNRDGIPVILNSRSRQFTWWFLPLPFPNYWWVILVFRSKGSAEVGTTVMGSPRKLSLGGNRAKVYCFSSVDPGMCHHSLLLNSITTIQLLYFCPQCQLIENPEEQQRRNKEKVFKCFKLDWMRLQEDFNFFLYIFCLGHTGKNKLLWLYVM